jgi:ABC-type transport system substrate-binding protein
LVKTSKKKKTKILKKEKKNMKKNYTVLTLLLVISSIILPLLPAVTVKAQDEPLIYRVKAYAPMGDWDNPIDPGWSIHSLWFMGVIGQDLTGGYFNYSGGVDVPMEEEWNPQLATDWTVTYWPEELNSMGFNNTGGIMEAEFTLRDGVYFHDGSKWNATVAKWNIDRYYIITGNLTQDGDLRNMDYYWPLVDDTEPYWTPSWNLSAYNDAFSWYYVGTETDYPNVNEVGGYVSNPNPWIGGEAYAPWDRYPLIQYVEILDNGTNGFGGTIKVYFNAWNTEGRKGTYMDYVSYHQYHANYTGRGVYGNQNGVKDPLNPTIVDHMVGTGTYYYVESDIDGGHLLKFEDHNGGSYWNITAIEALGFYDIDRVELINFPTTEAGALAANNALLTHAIDMAVDSSDMPLDTNAVKNNPNLKWYQGAPGYYPVDITLNSINETWWAWPWVKAAVMTPSYPNEEGEPWAQGIPHALRKAITWAYDYDHLIDVGLEGKAVRSGGIAGNGIFYNASVPMPYFNKTFAREVLLT